MQVLRGAHHIQKPSGSESDDGSILHTTFGYAATKEDIHNATLSSNWSAISYQSLGSHAFAIAKAYYIDYPLLYLNIPPLPALGAESNPVPYLVSTPMPSGQFGTYIAQCSSSPIVLLVDGSPKIDRLQCGIFLITYVLGAISLPSESSTSVQIYRPVRNVF